MSGLDQSNLTVVAFPFWLLSMFRMKIVLGLNLTSVHIYSVFEEWSVKNIIAIVGRHAAILPSLIG